MNPENDNEQIRQEHAARLARREGFRGSALRETEIVMPRPPGGAQIGISISTEPRPIPAKPVKAAPVRARKAAKSSAA